MKMSKRQDGYIVIKIDELHPHPRRRRKLIKDIIESPDYACALVDALVIERGCGPSERLTNATERR